MKKPGLRSMSPEKIQSLVNVALGKEKADLVVKGGDLVNVYTGEIQRGYGVAVKGDRIAYVGENVSHTIGANTSVIDASGKTIIPGLIDAHTHMFSGIHPPEYIKFAMIHGTTTIITEIQEVTFPLGLRGARFFMDYLTGQPIKFFCTAPPLVTPSKTAQASYLTRAQMRHLLEDDRVVGMGEIYWLPLVNGEERLVEMVSDTLAAGRRQQGHAAGARKEKLVAYFSAGVTSCHESVTLEEALEKLRFGVSVMIREGNIRSELPAIVKIQENGVDLRLLSFVSDGASAQTFVENGYIDYIVGQAIRHGFEPVKAIQAATINPATHFALDDMLGGIAPARYADILVIPDPKTIKPDYVISNGQIVAQDGRALVEPRQKKWPAFITTSFRLPGKLSADDFQIRAKARDGKVKVRVIEQVTDLVTRELIAEVPISQGSVLADTGQDILKLAAISRVGQPGKMALGLVKGYGLKRGALASSGAWDGDNILVAGASESDMALSVNRVAELHGGVVVCCDGKILAELPLPVAGVMCAVPMETLYAKMEEIQRAVSGLGTKLTRAALSLDVLTTAAIPHLRITEAGIYNVRENKFVDLFVE